jgi:20S proteasome subunit alpha 6
LYEFSPSGNSFDYIAMSIGARSQSAKTYLERHYESFKAAKLDELIVHGLRALRDTLQQDKELTVSNCSISYVGKDDKFVIVEGDALRVYVYIYSKEIIHENLV